MIDSETYWFQKWIEDDDVNYFISCDGLLLDVLTSIDIVLLSESVLCK